VNKTGVIKKFYLWGFFTLFTIFNLLFVKFMIQYCEGDWLGFLFLSIFTLHLLPWIISEIFFLLTSECLMKKKYRGVPLVCVIVALVSSVWNLFLYLSFYLALNEIPFYCPSFVKDGDGFFIMGYLTIVVTCVAYITGVLLQKRKEKKIDKPM